MTNAPTRGQEYRGIVITVGPVSGVRYGDWFAARAGGRTAITRGFTSPEQALEAATLKIDEAYAGEPEKVALWVNDTAHWRADQAAAARKGSVKAAPVLLAALEALVDAHARGVEPSEALWRDAVGALAQAKG